MTKARHRTVYGLLHFVKEKRENKTISIKMLTACTINNSDKRDETKSERKNNNCVSFYIVLIF